MQLQSTKCIRNADGLKTCIHCQNICIKNGKAHGKQRYRCKGCKRSHTEAYTYHACKEGMNLWIKGLLKEGCGVRSIARLLKISATTVLKKILAFSKQIRKPVISFGKEYELDELRTYVKSKTGLCWIVYAIRRNTKAVIDFAVGRRTNRTLKRVTDTLILSDAGKVYTDKLRNYKWLLPEGIHSTTGRGTNHIERKNLTLRTHLKRLSRRTICYSKSAVMLSACLKIYFWG